VGTGEALECLEKLGVEEEEVRRGLMGRRVVVGMGSRSISLAADGAVRIPWDYYHYSSC